MPTAAGPNIAEFDIEQEIGRGTAACVYRARDKANDRTVALKILRGECTDTVRERFRRECVSAIRVRHPNVVAVYDVGQFEGRPYMVMELIDGKPLDLKRPLRATVEALVKVAVALDTAHREGVVHRDLKPANILVDAAGEPHIVDFGLAHLIDGSATVTKRGFAVGTPAYMAPEQVCGWKDVIGPATDVYAMGAMLYEALAGRPPHIGKHATAVIQSIRTTDPPAPPGPRPIVDVCLKAIERVAAKRYSRASAFADALGDWLNAEAVTRMTRRRPRP